MPHETGVFMTYTYTMSLGLEEKKKHKYMHLNEAICLSARLAALSIFYILQNISHTSLVFAELTAISGLSE